MSWATFDADRRSGIWLGAVDVLVNNAGAWIASSGQMAVGRTGTPRPLA
jgi:hypothetical protein